MRAESFTFINLKKLNVKVDKPSSLIKEAAKSEPVFSYVKLTDGRIFLGSTSNSFIISSDGKETTNAFQEKFKWVSNAALYKGTLILFLFEHPFGIYKEGQMVWQSSRSITKRFVGDDWSMFSGYAQVVKSSMFVLCGSERQLVKFDLEKLIKVPEFPTPEDQFSEVIREGVSEFAADATGNVYYVVTDSMALYVNKKEIAKIDLENNKRVYAMAATGSEVLLGILQRGPPKINIFELRSPKGQLLDSLRMEPEGKDSGFDIKSLKTVTRGKTTVVVALRLYECLDLLAIKRGKLILVQRNIYTRTKQPEDHYTIVNHGLVVCPKKKPAGFDVISMQDGGNVVEIHVTF